MTTQYTPTLKLALPVTGELSGTWGDVVNDNITSMIEQAIAGLSTINTWTSNAHTLTTASGTTSESRCAMLVAATGGGAPTAAAQIICPAAAKLYVLQNNTSFAVTLKTSAGTGVAVAAGDTAFLFCDSTNVNSCVTTIVDGHITGNLTVDGNTTLGNATSDTITATARFNTDLIPSTDNARDLGSSANSWKDLYIDGTATIATLNVTTIDTTNLEVTNIKAKDGTAALQIADTTGVVSVTAAPVMTALTASKPVFTDASKALTSSGTLAYDQGGTGQTSYAAGDIVYANATNTLAKLTIGSSGQRLVVAAGLPSWATDATIGTVTSVAQSFTGGIVSVAGSPITTSGTLALTVAGNSGGVPYFSTASTWASSNALAASALVIGGGAGAAPSTTTTGTGVVTALGVNTGTAGAFVVNGGALGTPSSGTVTNLTGTASININGTVGATTPGTGAFTTLSASSTLAVGASVTGALSQFESSSLKQIKITYPSVASYFLNTNASGNLTIDKDGSLISTFSSTGLAVTGTLSATGAGSIQGLTVGLGAGAVATNTAVGSGALAANISGANSTAVGYGTLPINTASSNTALGSQAGNGVTSATNMIAIGYRSIYGNSGFVTGGSNIGIGNETFYNLLSGTNNVAIGHQSLYSNNTGSSNTAVGFDASKANTSGQPNTAIGAGALVTNTIGANNVAVGGGLIGSTRGAMDGNISGSQNTAVGVGALSANTTVDNNTAVGYQALYSNTTGPSNTALGFQAGYTQTTGNGGGNVFIGYRAGYSGNGYQQTILGNDAGLLSTGNNNTFVGNESGSTMTSGTGNTILGRFNGNQDGLDIRILADYIVLSDGNGARQITMKEGQSLALDSAIPQTGTGITFPATQSASSDANTLDDYEEGTWTVNLRFGGTSTGITYYSRAGKYTKIGNSVVLAGSFYLDSKASNTGDADITGLPFTVTTSIIASPAALSTSEMTFTGYPQLIGQANEARVQFYQTPTTGTKTTLTDANFTNATIEFSLAYLV